jgi:hypothetical protein
MPPPRGSAPLEQWCPSAVDAERIEAAKSISADALEKLAVFGRGDPVAVTSTNDFNVCQSITR